MGRIRCLRFTTARVPSRKPLKLTKNNDRKQLYSSISLISGLKVPKRGLQANSFIGLRFTARYSLHKLSTLAMGWISSHLLKMMCWYSNNKICMACNTVCNKHILMYDALIYVINNNNIQWACRWYIPYLPYLPAQFRVLDVLAWGTGIFQTNCGL